MSPFDITLWKPITHVNFLLEIGALGSVLDFEEADPSIKYESLDGPRHRRRIWIECHLVRPSATTEEQNADTTGPEPYLMALFSEDQKALCFIRTDKAPIET